MKQEYTIKELKKMNSNRLERLWLNGVGVWLRTYDKKEQIAARTQINKIADILDFRGHEFNLKLM